MLKYIALGVGGLGMPVESKFYQICPRKLQRHKTPHPDLYNVQIYGISPLNLSSVNLPFANTGANRIPVQKQK